MISYIGVFFMSFCMFFWLSIDKLDGQLEEVKKQKVIAKKKVTTTKKKIDQTKKAKKQSMPKKVVKSKDEAVKSAAANIRKRTRKWKNFLL